MLLVAMVRIVMLGVAFFYLYAECRYAECRGAPLLNSVNAVSRFFIFHLEWIRISWRVRSSNVF